MRVIIADLETDGLLDTVSTIHLLVLRVYDDGIPAGAVEVYRSDAAIAELRASPITYPEFLEPEEGEWNGRIEMQKPEHRCGDGFAFGPGNTIFKTRTGTIADGQARLATADIVVGHNWATYDDAVLQKLCPDFDYKNGALIRDTMVMARMMNANIKEKDFRLQEKGQLEGKYIGRHELGAYGQRMGLPKGDYSDALKTKAVAAGVDAKDKETLRRIIWGRWSPEQEGYAVRDIEVTELLWHDLSSRGWPDASIRLEHRIHHIMHLQQEFGFDFDVERAQELAGEVNADYDQLHAYCVAHFGKWWRPDKWSKVAPRPEYGEDDSRKIWGEVVCPTKTIRYKDPLRPDREEGHPFCPMKVVEFNPNSRPQIIDRLTKVYGWEPVDFTDKGNPEVSDDVLRSIAKDIPIAESLAELFFLAKLLGALERGDNAWLAIVDEHGKIHGYVNVGGTVSRRASHLSPNMAQVPKVATAAVRDEEGKFTKKVIDKKTGEPFPFVFDADGTEKKKTILYGRPGKYGYECRSLFRGPRCDDCEGSGRAYPYGEAAPACASCSGTGRWHMMGCDLKGIELRCLGARLAEFDAGAYLKVILEGDPHETNRVAFQLESRDNAKTCLYAIMYGGGDEKVGSIVMPATASLAAIKLRGKGLKANLQSGIPAFGKLIAKIGRQARSKKFLESLDGGKLFVRSPHAALNLQLQSDAALIAKLWVIFVFDMMDEDGFVFGVDWGLLAWVHDEIQIACRTKAVAERAAEIALEAAKLAGEYFDYPAPVEADAKIGLTWQETH